MIRWYRFGGFGSFVSSFPGFSSYLEIYRVAATASEIMIWGWVKGDQNNVRIAEAVKNDPVVLVGGAVTNVGRFANGQFANVWGRRFVNVQ